MAIAVIAAATGLILLGTYGWVRMMRPRVDQLRRDMPGHLVTLPQGQTHAAWHGPRTGPVLVCVHGLSTPSYVWDPLLPLLTGLGYRVLTYDLFGRGYSDRVPGRQTTRFFLKQLEDLLISEGVGGQFALMGYSMGGAIATSYASTHPDRVKRLILLAPAGLDLALGRFSDAVAKIPLLGDWVMDIFGQRILRHGQDESNAITRRALDDLAVAGTLAAVLSAQRGILSEDQAELHGMLASASVPVLAIWGERDSVIPLTSRDRMNARNPTARHAVLPDADHRLTYTHAPKVAELIGSPV